MENLKTLWQLLQEVVEEQDYYYSLHEFLLESTEEERKEIEKKLVDADVKQFNEFMDGFNFVNKTEIEMAVVEYFEKVSNRPACMGEMGDLYDVAEDYIRDRKIELDDDDNVLPYNQ